MICIDTSVLIWGFERTARAGQEPMIDRCVRFLGDADREKREMIIPALVLAEFLAATKRRQEIYTKLRKQYHVPPFDADAANILGELEANRNVVAQVRQSSAEPRHCLKVDMMIIATAIAAKADKIITHNLGEYTILAQGRISIADIPMPAPRSAAPPPRSSSVQSPREINQPRLFGIWDETNDEANQPGD